jgi:hypothetical protein
MMHHNRDDKPEELTPAEYKAISEEVLRNTERAGFTKGVMFAFQQMRMKMGITLDKIDEWYDACKEEEARFTRKPNE